MRTTIQNHPSVFKPGLGTVKGITAKLEMKPDARPKFCKARPVPYALQQAVEAEYNRLESEGIVERVEFSEWATPMVQARVYIQLFRERLSQKVHATIPKVIVGGFEFTVLSKKFERMTREAIDVCWRVLKESNKIRFDSYSVRNSVLVISHITFRDCRVHIFSENLSRNSCIQPTVPVDKRLPNLRTMSSSSSRSMHFVDLSETNRGPEKKLAWTT